MVYLPKVARHAEPDLNAVRLFLIETPYAAKHPSRRRKYVRFRVLTYTIKMKFSPSQRKGTFYPIK